MNFAMERRCFGPSLGIEADGPNRYQRHFESRYFSVFVPLSASGGYGGGAEYRAEMSGRKALVHCRYPAFAGNTSYSLYLSPLPLISGFPPPPCPRGTPYSGTRRLLGRNHPSLHCRKTALAVAARFPRSGAWKTRLRGKRPRSHALATSARQRSRNARVSNRAIPAIAEG
jgi:hypothetical protein